MPLILVLFLSLWQEDKVKEFSRSTFEANFTASSNGVTARWLTDKTCLLPWAWNHDELIRFKPMAESLVSYSYTTHFFGLQFVTDNAGYTLVAILFSGCFLYLASPTFSAVRGRGWAVWWWQCFGFFTCFGCLYESWFILCSPFSATSPSCSQHLIFAGTY